MRLAERRKLSNIRWIGQQPRENMPQFISAADVCLVLLKKTDLFKTVIPTKLLEFMSCGRPVILGVDGQAREIIEQANAGLFVEPENSGELSQTIEQLASNTALRAAFGQNGRRYIVERFSRHQTAGTYVRVLEKLVEGEAQQAAAKVARPYS
jgi:glycosyltransferase involved in cell wall biosynthesis